MKFWRLALPIIALLGVVIGAGFFGAVTPDPKGDTDLIWIEPVFPKPLFQSGPFVCDLPNLEKPSLETVVKRFQVPKGTQVVSMGKPVTTSAPAIEGSSPSMLTDGDPSSGEGNVLVLPKGTQWVQVDLLAPYSIQKLHLWHDQGSPHCDAYRDLIIQVSNDPDFKDKVTTLFNADFSGSMGFGKGIDPAYVETNHGRVINGRSVVGRYVRVRGSGSYNNGLNRYVELTVYGLPVR